MKKILHPAVSIVLRSYKVTTVYSTLVLYKLLGTYNVVDRVGSGSFCRIGIGIQGMPIRIGINSKHIYLLLLFIKFQFAVQNDTFAIDEKGKTL